MRVLAIDYGDARTGIAISDASGSIVGRTTVIHSRRPQQTAEAIAALVQESGAERLVMGFPRNMDGTEGRARRCTARWPTRSRLPAAWRSCSGTNDGRPLRHTRS